MMPPVAIRVDDLAKHFKVHDDSLGSQTVRAVDGVSFEVHSGETLGLVGESGCGKSTLARLIMRLLPVTSGHVYLRGDDLTAMRGAKLRRARLQLQMIFQDPYASLNPRMTVGEIIAQPLHNFRVGGSNEKRQRVRDVMEKCGLNSKFINRYPHEFSGGQRQRVGIARALVLSPSVVVADEPVSALDVSIQAQIINLLKRLQGELDLTYLFIAHDLAIVRHLSDRVAVMYLGKIVELGSTADLYNKPLHPYTRVLLSSIPVPDPDLEASRRPIVLTGEIPSPIGIPSGCRFHTRCPIARFPICANFEPPLQEHGAGHNVACHFPGEL